MSRYITRGVALPKTICSRTPVCCMKSQLHNGRRDKISSWTTAIIPPENILYNEINLSSFVWFLLHWYAFTGCAKCNSKAWLLSNSCTSGPNTWETRNSNEDNNNIYHKQYCHKYVLYVWFISWLFEKHCLKSSAFKQLLPQSWEILTFVLYLLIIFLFLFFFTWLNMYVCTYLNLLRLFISIN